ncbi:MAG: DUF2118 domain-containing protein [Desulfurococcales archaeon]|nr:DUF2118 domain-containing protein [Desulfurococcales archaeon]
MSLNHTFKPSDYEFPRLYIRGRGSGEYMVVDLERRAYRLTRSPPPGGVALGLAPYEAGWGVVFDPVEARVARDFAVVLPWAGGRALYVRAGTPVMLVEAAGRHVNLVAREGSRVRARNVLAYVVTGRGDTRTVRAGVEGVVVYIAWDAGAPHERYAYLIASPADVEELEPEPGG